MGAALASWTLTSRAVKAPARQASFVDECGAAVNEVWRLRLGVSSTQELIETSTLEAGSLSDLETYIGA